VRASHAIVAGVATLLAASAASARWASHARNPEVALLVDRGAGRWIIADEPFSLARRPDSEMTTSFGAGLRLERRVESAQIALAAFRTAGILVDGMEIALPAPGPRAWKEPLRATVGPLAEGEHRIEVRVRNRNGPPALLLESAALGLATGPGWEARPEGAEVWAPARLASAERRPALVSALETAPEALRRLLPFHLLVVALVAGATWLISRPIDPARLRLVFLWAWALLAANNVLRIPEGIGFDTADHLDYIRWVAEKRSIPLATDGWQMFQSPLYYIISAPLLLALEGILGPITISGQLLRIIPLACGAAQVEVVYRVLRIVFPTRPDLQRLGLVAGSFLPMNIYMSQYVGNEPLAGLLSATAILCALRIDGGAPLGSFARRLLALGAALGLALLAKATAALLVVPLAAYAGLAAARAGSRARAAVAAALPLATACAIAAPYYARNWILLGKPFVGGWDASRGISWWQDPGYRMPDDLASFGAALVQPVHAAASSFWDGVHSTLFADGYLSSMISAEGLPPWNFGFLLSGALLSLLPAAAMLLGAALALGGCVLSDAPSADERRAWLRAGLLSAVTIGIYLVAMADLFIALPVYSTVKASYMSGLTPCLAILAAAGLEPVARSRPARALAHGAVAAWAASAYLAYFVV
jgi:hypothetical protein